MLCCESVWTALGISEWINIPPSTHPQGPSDWTSCGCFVYSQRRYVAASPQAAAGWEWPAAALTVPIARQRMVGLIRGAGPRLPHEWVYARLTRACRRPPTELPLYSNAVKWCLCSNTSNIAPLVALRSDTHSQLKFSRTVWFCSCFTSDWTVWFVTVEPALKWLSD